MKRQKEPTDRERLDWLGNYVREEHSLMLWDGTFKPDFISAGLSFGARMKRSLRDAIDSASGAEHELRARQMKRSGSGDGKGC